MDDALIIETKDGDTWAECRSCGRCNWISKGPIGHKRGCSTSTAQYGVAAVAPVSTESLRTFARNVRTYSQTKGRDSDVLAAVRAGYLSESDAMNTDD